MEASIEVQTEALRTLPSSELRRKYREVFGEESRSGNRQFLFRRVAWRMQALAEGGLAERARRRALEIANDADLRVEPSKAFLRHSKTVTGRDPRLPVTGTVVRRIFKARSLDVKVLEDGFEFEGRRYQSLSAIASEVTGTRWNGFAFFGLTGTQKENV